MTFSDTPVVLVSSEDDSVIVRWFPDLWSAERNHVMLTASSKGVSVHTAYLTQIPDQWLDEAKDVYGSLKRNPFLDLSHLATHRHSGPSNGPIVPVSE